MLKYFSKRYAIALYLITLLVTAACSRSSYTAKPTLHDVFFFLESKETGEDIEQIRNERLNIVGKRLVVLPFYTELHSELKKLSLARQTEILKQLDIQLREILEESPNKLNLKVLSHRYNNQIADGLVSKELKDFQSLLFQVAISERNLATNVAKFNQADLILSAQVNYWPSLDEKKEISSLYPYRIELMLWLIDAKSGYPLWMGINNNEVSQDAMKNAGAGLYKTSRDLLNELVFDFFDDF